MLEISIIFGFYFFLLCMVSVVASSIAVFLESDIADKLVGASLVLLCLNIIYIAVVIIVALTGELL